MVCIGAVEEAFSLRKRLHDEWQEQLLPAIEKAFDEVEMGDRTLHIPKLELHLSVDSLEEFMEQLPDLVNQQIREQLQAIDGLGMAGERSLAMGTTISEHQQWDTLLHYLRTGSLPWQASYAPPSEITAKLQETCQQQWSTLLHELRIRTETPPFYFRLLQLIPQERWSQLVRDLGDRLPQWRAVIGHLMDALIHAERVFLNRHTQLKLAGMVLAESLKEQNNQSSSHWIAALQRFFSQEEKNALQTILVSSPIAEMAELLQQLPNPIKEGASQSMPSAPLPETEEAPQPMSGAPLPETKGVAMKAEPLSTPPPDTSLYPPIFQLSATSSSDEFPLSVRYAGLVLIQPFLTRFFEATGVKDADNRKIFPFQLPRAAALLHFLATGNEEVFEHELSFIKVLLGVSPEVPLLVSEGLIQPSDREEIEGLLRSVISYWSVLKNTSINGLRSSFLQRQGLLREVEGGWQIQVERESFDMLLNQLPWSISIIKLPWMKKPIYTEWQMP
jgi:hypothetical protein